jgi:hypothetical protein
LATVATTFCQQMARGFGPAVLVLHTQHNCADPLFSYDETIQNDRRRLFSRAEQHFSYGPGGARLMFPKVVRVRADRAHTQRHHVGSSGWRSDGHTWIKR